MNNDVFEAMCRAGEKYHELRAESNKVILRVDGRNFTALCNKNFSRPLDERFHEYMLEVAKALMDEFHARYAYTESDEVSLLLGIDHFGRKVEKLVSISASTASAVMSTMLGFPVTFDSRIWEGDDLQNVVDYFRWRQADCSRNCLNTWCHWTLIGKGVSPMVAEHQMSSQSLEDKKRILEELKGVKFDDLPSWQRLGVALYWEAFNKPATNPVTREPTVAVRHSLKVDKDLPQGKDYSDFLRARLNPK